MAGPQLQVEGIANLKAIRILNAPGAIDINSLEGIDTSSIPNRSLCYVVENEALYRFFEESVVPPAPPGIVQPNFGGQLQPGRWFIVSSGGGGAGSGCMVASKLVADTQLQQVIPPNVSTPLAFNDVEINTLGGADLPNNQIIIPADGTYLITGRVLVDAQDIDSRADFEVRRNGTAFFVSTDAVLDPAVVGNRDIVLQVAEIQDFVAGDVVTAALNLSTSLAGQGTVDAASLTATSTDCGTGDIAGLDIVGDFEFFSQTPAVAALPGGGAFADAPVPWVPGPANAGFTHLGAGVVRYDGPVTAKFKIEATVAGSQVSGSGETIIIAISKSPGVADQRWIPDFFDDDTPGDLTTHLVNTISPGDLLTIRLACGAALNFNVNAASFTITPAGGVATPTQSLPAGLFGAKITGVTSVPNTGVDTPLNLDVVENNGDNMADTANDRLVINTGGRYIVTLFLLMTTLPDTGVPEFRILVNGVPRVTGSIETLRAAVLSDYFDLPAGALITAVAAQEDSGGAQDVVAFLSAARVGS
jgi:hypothetical protein